MMFAVEKFNPVAAKRMGYLYATFAALLFVSAVAHGVAGKAESALFELMASSALAAIYLCLYMCNREYVAHRRDALIAALPPEKRKALYTFIDELR